MIKLESCSKVRPSINTTNKKITYIVKNGLVIVSILGSSYRPDNSKAVARVVASASLECFHFLKHCTSGALRLVFDCSRLLKPGRGY